MDVSVKSGGCGWWGGTDDGQHMESGAMIEGAQNARCRRIDFPCLLSSFCLPGARDSKVGGSLFLLYGFHLLERMWCQLRRKMTWIVVVGMESPEETGEGFQVWDEQGLMCGKACLGRKQGHLIPRWGFQVDSDNVTLSGKAGRGGRVEMVIKEPRRM